MEATKKKNDVLQIMRGIAIVLVLFRHAIAQVNADVVLDAIEEIIICFHMPVFFMIAGFLFQKGLTKYIQKGKMNFLIGKAKHLLLPYVFWTILLWLGVQIACMSSSAVLAKMTEIGFAPMSVGNLLYGLLTYQVYYTEHLWFLYVLFLFFVVNIIAERTGSTMLALRIWGLVGILTVFVTLPHIIERAMIWGIFFAFGRFTYQNRKTEKMSGGRYRACICLMFLIGVLIRLVGLNSGITGKLFLVLMQLDKYLLGFAGAGLVYILAIEFSKTNAKKLVKCIGDYSFDIYLMHNPYCVAISAMALNKILGVPAYISIAIATVIGVVLPMAASKLVIRKVKLLSTVMIGR